MARGVTVRRFRSGDAKGVARLIRDTFAEFNAPDATPDGTRWFLESLDDVDDVRASFLRSPICHVACRDGRIVGFVRGRTDKLTTLFVSGRCHGKGIGRRLVELFEREAAAAGAQHIKLRSTLDAVPFYTRMGFKKTTGVRSHHGIKIQPMRKVLAPRA